MAAALALRLNGTVALAHVFETIHFESLPKQLYNQLRAKRKAELKTEAQRLRKTGITVEETFLEGSPASALTEFATKTQAGLVVVSSLGQIAPSLWFVGSVAERIAQTVAVPTLVVRGEAPFKAWAEHGQPLNVLVGYDFSATSEVALRWVGGLRKIGPCRVTVAWVPWPAHESNRLGFVGPSGLPDNPPEVQKFLERDLRKQCQHIFDDSNVEIRVAGTWGRPEPQLLEMAKAEQADLIVVGTHQRRGLERLRLGSVSRGILHHAPMSVACVPPLAGAAPPATIPVFQRVLVPTDFSALGNQAVPFAYSTLSRGGSVCLLHVREQTKKKADGEACTPGKLEQQLRALIPAEAEARWIVTSVEVVEGKTPSAAICQAAERFGADLICMGTHGRSGLSKTILGSVTQDVISQSHRPVLLVRPPVP